MSRELFRFPGGVRLPAHKAESSAHRIHAPLVPPRLVIPLCQHAGAAALSMVALGQHVRKGQMIAAADGPFSAAVHASSSGTVVAIGPAPVPNLAGLPEPCIIIDTDGLDEWAPRAPLDYRALTPDAMHAELCDLGLVGLGGAVFPLAVKLDRGGARWPLLILNGAECEPWISCDDALMRHHAAEIVQGLGVMRHLLDSDEVLIAIQDDKPEAIAAMRDAAGTLGDAVEVVVVPSIYPGGGARQLVKTLTGKEVPSGGLPADLGIQVFNVGTARALCRAVIHGEPLISRLVTVTGHVLRPQNFEALIGTPLSVLIQAAGERDGQSGVVMGGPLMGVPLRNTAMPVVKASTCILVQSPELFPPLPPALPCIRCARCAAVCPAVLQPQDLFRFARTLDLERADEMHLFDCIECGCCNHVCPSHIPLVDFFRDAKNEIASQAQARQAADQARARYEFRLFRQHRDASEKADRMAAQTRARRAEWTASTAPESAAPGHNVPDATASGAGDRAAPS